jgi:acetyl esterase/lipase
MKKIYLFLLFGWLYFIGNGQITQPAQPTTGPGSNNPLYTGVTQYDYGTNANADGFWLFEPQGPVPDSANLVVFIHGWGETNLKYYGAFIDRIVRAGNIVICPRYQKTADIVYSTYTDSCALGIQRALDTLQLAWHVKPRLYNYFILGHSMGGVLVANMTAEYAYYNLPKPLAAFSIEPGADLAGLVLSDSVYAGFPADVKYLIAIGNDDNIVDSTTGKLLFNLTTAVPTSHKNLVRQFADSHGSPAITATHFEPCSISTNTMYDNGESNIATLVTPALPPDAVDFYCYWKLWDALVACALSGQDCDVAFGDTPQQKFMGNWSDGTPLTPLLVIPSAATAISEPTNNPEIRVYPNPVSGGSFQVEISRTETNSFFQLYDVNGRKILEQKLTARTTTFTSPLSAGIYFYQVRNIITNTAAIGKLVVQ